MSVLASDSTAATPSGEGNQSEYDHLWRLAEEAKEAGRLHEALDLYAAAHGAAERVGDRLLIDRALCNHAAIGITLGEPGEWISRMREVLMHNGSEINSYLAAYNISVAYGIGKEPKKSLFYARIARQHAVLLDEPQRIGAAANQIANALLADSYFEDAAKTYREALRLLAGRSSWMLICSLNLAYCELVMGQRSQPLSRLYGALREASRRRDPRLMMIASVDLCYAHLELGRLRSAERFGLRGLALAEEIGELDWVKNALYLLGEVAVLAGRTGDARERFSALQTRFYPGQPNLPDLLVGVDLRRVINLRA